MTRPVRIAGVVVVAALVVAIPALASGHDRAAMHATSVPALLCVGPVAPGSSSVVLTPAPGTQARPHQRTLRTDRAHKRGKHSKGAPAFRCIPPCGWIVTQPAGATGLSGRPWPADCEPRLICVRAEAGQARLCPPCVVEAADGPDDATGTTTATGTTLACLPIRCLIPYPYTTRASGATGTTTCPLPPICPLMGAARASICPAPCVFAGTGAPTGTTGTKPICPPIPPCPPPPTAMSTQPALYACPELAGGTATAG